MKEDRFELAMRVLSETVATRIREIVEFLTTKGLSEFDAITLVLEEAEYLLDNIEITP